MSPGRTTPRPGIPTEMALTSPRNRPEGSEESVDMEPSFDAFFPRESAPASSPIATKLGPRDSPYRRAWLLGAMRSSRRSRVETRVVMFSSVLRASVAASPWPCPLLRRSRVALPLRSKTPRSRLCPRPIRSR